jgi:hypothetical protein
MRRKEIAQMARSPYIYLIRFNGNVVSAHTVKHEAHTWAKHYGCVLGGKEQLQLTAMRDGAHVDKTEREVKWNWQ